MKYETVVFDLDGTLLNTLEDIADSVNHILTQYGYPKRSLKEIRSFVGNGLRKLMERAIPKQINNALFEKIYTEFVEYYNENCAHKTRLYDGIEELLISLKGEGYKIAVVSNKDDVAVKELCAMYLPGLIGHAIGESKEAKCKPAPDMLFLALDELKSNLDESIFVGDSEVDILTAKNANMKCLSVLWGFRTKEFLEKNGATDFVNQPKEILTFLQQL